MGSAAQDPRIEQARKALYTDIQKRAVKEFANRWAIYEPMILDYFGGLTIGEIASKYDRPRTIIHYWFKKYGIKPLNGHILRTISTRAPYWHDMIKDVEKCNCELCQFVTARVKRKKRYS